MSLILIQKKDLIFLMGEEISGSSVLNNLIFINNVKIKNMNNDWIQYIVDYYYINI